ncbi:MAG: sugar phosphate isomerase/epimerase [Treponema sp.]|nr:sugar phosphate isomerase/epimerase [Treponema sp.]
MKFGLCTGPENLELAARLGFDYIECNVSAVESMSDADFAALLSKVKASKVKVECLNVLFPGTIHLVGPEADKGKTAAYLEKAFARVKELGGRTVVFGSGRSRVFPQELPYRDGFAELIRATKLIGETAAKYGITIAIEPLNRSETNCVNSVREGAMLAAAADLSSVQVLADLYHMLRENEPMDNLLTVKKLRHTHIALLEGRAFPTVCDKDVSAFFGALKQIGYTGTMSVEGKAAGDFEADAAASLKVLRAAAG